MCCVTVWEHLRTQLRTSRGYFQGVTPAVDIILAQTCVHSSGKFIMCAGMCRTVSPRKTFVSYKKYYFLLLYHCYFVCFLLQTAEINCDVYAQVHIYFTLQVPIFICGQRLVKYNLLRSRNDLQAILSTHLKALRIYWLRMKRADPCGVHLWPSPLSDKRQGNPLSTDLLLYVREILYWPGIL